MRTKRPSRPPRLAILTSITAAGVLLAAGLLAGCTANEPAAEAEGPDIPEWAADALPPDIEAISVLGDTLRTAPIGDDARAAMEADLAAARADYDAEPTADAIIWLGRRTAYLGRYREAIDIYTEGIERFPDDARMYRHRGHRYISTRQFDRAIRDFERAASLVEGQPDEVEPDGQPNERGIPTSTLQSNIFYHLGLARYVTGDFEGALEAYRRSMDVSGNPDMLVATSHWLYMTLRRLGRDEEAARVLEPITADLDVIENDSYHQLLLMYKGEVEPGTLWGADDALGNATVGYGIGNWHLYNGRRDEAVAAFERVLETGQWASFGYIAAESDVARLR